MIALGLENCFFYLETSENPIFFLKNEKNSFWLEKSFFQAKSIFINKRGDRNFFSQKKSHSSKKHKFLSTATKKPLKNQKKYSKMSPLRLRKRPPSTGNPPPPQKKKRKVSLQKTIFNFCWFQFFFQKSSSISCIMPKNRCFSETLKESNLGVSNKPLDPWFFL